MTFLHFGLNGLLNLLSIFSGEVHIHFQMSAGKIKQVRF